MKFFTVERRVAVLGFDLWLVSTERELLKSNRMTIASHDTVIAYAGQPGEMPQGTGAGGRNDGRSFIVPYQVVRASFER